MLNGNTQGGTQGQRSLNQPQNRSLAQEQRSQLQGASSQQGQQGQEGLLPLTQGQTLLESVPGGEILTADRRMKDVIQLAVNVSQSKATVLIQGESGTGKELMAALIHSRSARAQKPFVAINCAAIPENLLESELFGYERGAFTGAVNSKAGKFEFANGGTILLDEISEMDIRLQAKLLRVIQEGEVDRIGGRRPVPVDVRIVATTNRNLSDCVRQGTFREDLFYRLNVVNLSLPALRERSGDVALLARRFMVSYAAKNGKAIASITDDALRVLSAHAFPGNVRELENIIERAVITAKQGIIQADDIHIARAPSASTREGGGTAEAMLGGWRPGVTLSDIERNVILAALSHYDSNRTHTAKALGISIRTLRNKLAEFRMMGIRV